MKKHRPSKVRWVAVSGGFDPIHVGHLRMLKAARKLGDKLVLILNNDAWLMSKKGYVFMPEEERAELLREFPFVDRVVITRHRKNDPDTSVIKELRVVRPSIFANGGDRKAGNVPEAAVCKELGINMMYNVGGGKVQSSSWLIDSAARSKKGRIDNAVRLQRSRKSSR